MNKEDQELLLKDLCARLPYGVKVNNEIQGDFNIYGICENLVFVRNEVCHIDFSVENIKPYLFPLLSMTEEQKIECFKGTPLEIDKYGYIEVKDDSHGNSLYTDLEIYLEVIDWLNKNHFDYRGLIPMGLAIDATGLNIYKKK